MRRHVHWPAELLKAGVILTLALIPAAASAGDEFPEDAAEAMRLHESRVDDWADGPVAWIMLEDERDRWSQLETTEQKRDFIRWFWDRRDDDLRDEGHDFKERFYARVAEANQRYAGFPRGWKSDRGRVHVVLGRPDAIRPHFGSTGEAVVWTYYTVGPQAEDMPVDSTLGEFSIAFTRTSMRTGYEIYGGFGGPGTFPLYVRDAFEYAKQYYVVNPDLEEPGTVSAMMSDNSPS